MVDYVLFASEKDLPTCKGLVTMMLPFAGVVLLSCDKLPAATFSRDIIFLMLWTENCTDFDRDVFEVIAKHHHNEFLVLHNQSLLPPGGLAVSSKSIVEMVGDGNIDRASIEQSLLALRAKLVAKSATQDTVPNKVSKRTFVPAMAAGFALAVLCAGGYFLNQNWDVLKARIPYLQNRKPARSIKDDHGRPQPVSAEVVREFKTANTPDDDAGDAKKDAQTDASAE